MVRSTTARSYARLSFEDGEVIVTPKDRSIFLMSAEKATEALRDAVRRQEGMERFESEILVPLHGWCAERSTKVQACYIPLPGNHLQVFIVTTLAQFDLDLGEEIAALERQLAQKGWRIGVMQLPAVDDGSLTAFFNPHGALEVYAQPGPTPEESGK